MRRLAGFLGVVFLAAAIFLLLSIAVYSLGG
jgi:hypothetical protein